MNRITSSAGLDDLVTYGRLAIDSSIESPSILAALANYGFDEARLQAGAERVSEHFPRSCQDRTDQLGRRS